MSMGVLSDGGSYGVPAGLMYSFPVRISADRSWEIVGGLTISEFARERMEATAAELIEEKEIAVDFLDSASSATAKEGKL